MDTIQAADPVNTSTLPRLPLSSLCWDHLNGLCRQGEHCSRAHTLCEVVSEPTKQEPPALGSKPNILSLEPRRSPYDRKEFEIDGPGHISGDGPRHDNDHANIAHIKVLPTTDEILSLRRPYMPLKDYASHVAGGVPKLTDLHFRHLRYDNVESINDVCYHSIQKLVTMGLELKLCDYDNFMQTPYGNKYSMFRDVKFVEAQFHDRRSLTFRVSFSCPKALRGRAIQKSSCLQEGMLAALVGYDPDKSRVSVSFVETVRCESTMAMSHSTKNDLRGQ